MKRKKLFLSAVVLSVASICSYSQNSINAGGGDASSAGGSVSYSVGQPFYHSNSGAGNSSSEGVQQAYEISVTSVNESFGTENISLTAFPNPTKDILTLSIDNFLDRNYQYKLFDLNGKLIASESMVNNSIEINMKALKAGTYIISLASNEISIKTFQIIKL